jgi:hypothetical protein
LTTAGIGPAALGQTGRNAPFVPNAVTAVNGDPFCRSCCRRLSSAVVGREGARCLSLLRGGGQDREDSPLRLGINHPIRSARDWMMLSVHV